MDVLSSIYTLDPFVNKEGFTAVIYEPTKFGFDDGQPYEFEFMVDDIFASWQRYTIYKHTISISWLHPYVGWVFKLKKAPHEKGLPVSPCSDLVPGYQVTRFSIGVIEFCSNETLGFI